MGSRHIASGKEGRSRNFALINQTVFSISLNDMPENTTFLFLIILFHCQIRQIIFREIVVPYRFDVLFKLDRRLHCNVQSPCSRNFSDGLIVLLVINIFSIREARLCEAL